jgi:hypothetical protein
MSSWADDPQVNIAWSKLGIASLGRTNRIVWQPTASDPTRGEVRIVPAFDPALNQLRLTVDMKLNESTANTTVVINDQQSVILALSGQNGDVGRAPAAGRTAVVLTPYLARGADQLAELRACKSAGGSEEIAFEIGSAQAATAGAAPTRPPSGRPRAFEIPGSLLLDVPSELTGKQHQLILGLPPSFEKEPTRRYPVLYLLDGQWDFSLVSALSGGLRYDQVLPEMLIVGLSYAGEDPDYGALRSDDYLPTRARGGDGKEKGGGAPRFLEWLESVVIPQMEKGYRADPERRILAGASYGGLFALHVLFENPELFWAYVAISPSVGWDNQEILRREKAFRKSRPILDRRVWLSSGSEEWPDYLAHEIAFFKQFAASRYRNLALKIHSVEGERHSGVKPEAYNRALRFIAEPLMPGAAK